MNAKNAGVCATATARTLGYRSRAITFASTPTADANSTRITMTCPTSRLLRAEDVGWLGAGRVTRHAGVPMRKRPPWLSRRIATQKALRELPKCAMEGCKNRGMGFFFVEAWNGKRMELMSLWYCP